MQEAAYFVRGSNSVPYVGAGRERARKRIRQRLRRRHVGLTAIILMSGWTTCALTCFLRLLTGWPEFAPVTMLLGCGLVAVGLVRLLLAGEMNPMQIVPCGTVLWYCGPTAYVDFVDPATISLASPTEIWWIASVVLASSAISYQLSALFACPRATATPLSRHSRSAILTVCLVGSVVQALLIANGTWTYGALLLYAQREPSLLLQIVGWLFRPVLILTALGLASDVARRRLTLSRTAAYVTIAAVQLAWLTIDGRRNLSLVLLLAVLGFAAILLRQKRITVRHAPAYAVAGTLFALIAFGSWQFYFAMRQQSNIDLAEGRVGSVVDMLGSMQTLESSSLNSAFQQNLLGRPLLLQESAAVVMENATGFLFGGGLLQAAATAVPSAMWPDKADSVDGTIELLWAKEIGVPFNDWSNTIFLEGYADCGFVGMPIYLVVTWALLRVGLLASRRAGSRVLGAYTATSMLLLLLSVEQSYFDYFVWARNILLLALIVGAGRRAVRRSSRILVTESAPWTLRRGLRA